MATAATAVPAALATELRLKPLFDRVIARPIDSGSKVLVPEGGKDRPMRLQVVAIGDGKPMEVRARTTPASMAVQWGLAGTAFWPDEAVAVTVFRPMLVGPGDIILVSKLAGFDIKVDGVDLVIIPEEQILAIEIPTAAEIREA